MQNNQDIIATIVSQTDNSKSSILTDVADTIQEKNDNPIYESSDKDDVYEDGNFLLNKPTIRLKFNSFDNNLSYCGIGEKVKLKAILKVKDVYKHKDNTGKKDSKYYLKVVAIKI